MALTPSQCQRYARHLALPEFGVAAQEKLLASSVLLIGAGGLGSPLALYLAAVGIGRLGIVDYDVVDVSNLQRQVIHRTADVGTPKARSAARAIRDLNPEVRVEIYEEGISSANALQLIANYDVVIDGTDNFPTRYLVNDACVLLNKVNIYGSIYRFEGQATVFDPRPGSDGARRGPCYRCLYPQPPAPGEVPSCAEGGVLGVLPGAIAMIQATEAIKILAGIGRPLVGRLLRYDALAMQWRELKIRRDRACPLCGDRPTISQLIDYEGFCGMRRGEDGSAAIGELSPAEYEALRARGEEHLLLDVREPFELAICQIEGNVNIPLGQLPQRLHEIAAWKHRLVVCQCKSGRRSLKAAETLRRHGFTRVVNLSGGILAWGEHTGDPAIGPY
ncbi:MAG: molybdopterin-synthase adenylyltransferase MoeB [Planctomycetota bacterium]|nr:molybdopterin-synthase adenylyltransferase MoeB [Planctomycetota bacterium]MDW8373236.1 molybdopterin-synthase adenylyltransferase MoeB [Planctomycetota bacterium]